MKVGDPVQDHQCWMRPENMETPRTVLMIDDKMPGTEIAAETSAAMASSSIVFRGVDRAYARRLLNKAKLVFHHIFLLFRFGRIEINYTSFFLCICSFLSLPKHIKELMMENAPSIAPSQATMSFFSTLPLQ